MESVMNVLNYQFLGVTLKDPIIFCIKAAAIYFFIRLVLWLIRKTFIRSQRNPCRSSYCTYAVS